jgi:capsid protein
MIPGMVQAIEKVLLREQDDFYSWTKRFPQQPRGKVRIHTNAQPASSESGECLQQGVSMNDSAA